MNKVINLNMIQVMQDRLEFEVKKELTERLVQIQMNEFEIKVRETVKSIVEQLTFNKIECCNDLIRMRDEYCIWIKWGDDKEKEIKKEDNP